MNNLFFKNIFNKNLKTVGENIRHDVSLSVEEAFKDSRFFVDDSSDVLRIIPLFVCETIRSSNKVDKVVEGMVICENNPSTMLYFNEGLNRLHDSYLKTRTILSSQNIFVNPDTSFDFIVKLTKPDNSAVANQFVLIEFFDEFDNKTDYSDYTDNNGEVTINLELSIGEYRMVTYYDGNNFNKSCNGGGMISVGLVTPTTLTSSSDFIDLTETTSVTFTLKDYNNLPLVNTDCVLNIISQTETSSSTYTTDIDGEILIEDLDTFLSPDEEYELKLQFNGNINYESSEITVKVNGSLEK